MRNKALFIVLALLFTVPALAQDGGCQGYICGPETGSGGGTGCWNCQEDCCWNFGCWGVGGDMHCVVAGDEESGDGIRCDENDDLIDGCHSCTTSGGPCHNTTVYG
jgi:hypothetical protein